MYLLTVIRRSAVAVSAVILVAAAGCGGTGGTGGTENKTCADACNNLFNCGTKLSVAPSSFLGPNYADVSSCINRCTTGSCPKAQQLVNCAAALQCNSLNQVETDAEACFTNSGCTP
jgi:hypothetical protein